MRPVKQRNAILAAGAERLLRCRPTFSKSLMVSEAVSKLGCSELLFDEPAGVKVDGRYYRDVSLNRPAATLSMGYTGRA